MQVTQYTYEYVCTAVFLNPAFNLVPPPSNGIIPKLATINARAMVANGAYVCIHDRCR